MLIKLALTEVKIYECELFKVMLYYFIESYVADSIYFLEGCMRMIIDRKILLILIVSKTS